MYLFLPGTLLLYTLVPKKLKNAVLLLASVAFYFCGEQLRVLLMLGEIALAYTAGRILDALNKSNSHTRIITYLNRRKNGKKTLLVLFLVLSLALLFVYKYTGLLEDTINTAAGRKVLRFTPPALPIGISFYTFQCMSYVIDVYRGKHPAERKPFSFALYVSFFPQLIAGPIVRYDTVADALKERAFTVARFGEGAFRFTLGLGKKVLLADLLFAFSSAGGSGVLLAWLQSFAYLLYVYFDFSGYSDMAIGLAKIFGFDIPENFNYPLVSRSLREFWRRWHISLGSWFRDYLYIPLGGSRRGTAITIRNLLIVWILTGLWHGAGWGYVVWGLSFGILIVLETLGEKRREKANLSSTGDQVRNTTNPERNAIDLIRNSADSEWKATELKRNSADSEWNTADLPGKLVSAALDRISRSRWFFAPLVLLLTVLIFVFFRFPNLTEAAAQFQRMFVGAFWTAESFYYIKGAVIILVAAVFGATPLPKQWICSVCRTSVGQKLAPFLQAAWMVAILLLVTASLVDGSFSPFLYFRF